jgi:D-aspartate ligase
VLGQDQIDLFRALALAGVRSVAVTPPDDWSRASRFVVASVDWVNHWTHQEELITRLERLGADVPARPVLFYQSDGDMLAVSSHRARLRRVFDFVLPDASVIESALDKSGFYRLAERLGIPVPRTALIEPGNGLGAADELPFPVVVKLPVRRYTDWAAVGGHAKAVRAETAAELRQIAERFAEADVTVLVQESIPGPESRIESYHAYVDERGDRVAEFTGRKLRTNPREYGESTALETTRAPDVVALGREVVAKLDLRGVCKVDFKRAPNGSLKVLEVNPRFNLWHHLGAVAGVNLPALVYADLTGRPRPRVRPARAGVRWCDWREDRHAARAHGMSSPEWARWLLGAQAKAGLWWDDPGPFLHHHLLPAAARRLRRAPAHIAPGRWRRA